MLRENIAYFDNIECSLVCECLRHHFVRPYYSHKCIVWIYEWYTALASTVVLYFAVVAFVSCSLSPRQCLSRRRNISKWKREKRITRNLYPSTCFYLNKYFFFLLDYIFHGLLVSFDRFSLLPDAAASHLISPFSAESFVQYLALRRL